MQRAAVALLVLIVAATSCSSSTADGSEWCSGFLDVLVAGLAFESADDGSPEEAAAAMDLEAASQAMVTTPVPDEIESDFDEIRRGPDVADAGESFSEAAKRIGEWAVANCGYTPEVIELLESDVP